MAKAIVTPGNWLILQTDVPGPNTNALTYAGVPGSNYVVKYATDLRTGPWLTLATNTVAADGRGKVLDSGAADGQRFYRVTEP